MFCFFSMDILKNMSPSMQFFLQFVTRKICKKTSHPFVASLAGNHRIHRYLSGGGLTGFFFPCLVVGKGSVLSIRTNTHHNPPIIHSTPKKIHRSIHPNHFVMDVFSGRIQHFNQDGGWRCFVGYFGFLVGNFSWMKVTS